jgi:hypothetical protein
LGGEGVRGNNNKLDALGQASQILATSPTGSGNERNAKVALQQVDVRHPREHRNLAAGSTKANTQQTLHAKGMARGEAAGWGG